jgi:hypothetical protein
MGENSKQKFSISKENWSLHRKGNQDQERHLEKVREAISKNLPDLISQENIIMSDGKDIVKIPIRSLDEYKIRYNHDKTKHVGQGDGDSQVGDVIARSPKKGDGEGGTEKPGDQPGEDYYEMEVTLADIEKALLKELELPNIAEKDSGEVKTKHIEFNDVRKKGLLGNIDKKRTILSALRRNATKGKPSITPIYNDDLRFKTLNESVKRESKAVVLAMMDTSASMGTFEKYVARSFFFWMNKFLTTKYETVEFEFIAHHTMAKVVSKEEFFSKGESGGTICSSAYSKALHLIEEKYSPSSYNIYPIHFSDGENITSDNAKCLKLVDELLNLSQMFGYGEVNSYNRYSTLMNTYRSIDHPNFRYYELREKKDVYPALKRFFSRTEVREGAQ